MDKIFDKIQKYNFWDNNLPELGYKRSEYLNRISKYTGNKLVKVLVGQRRVGKSYILRQLIHHLIHTEKVNPDNIFYVNKEYLAFDEIKNSADLEQLFNYYKQQRKVKGKIYLFIDEIQNIAQWETFVNSYAQDFTADYEIFITGSNSKLLSGELASLLSGRYIQFEIFPFSFFEYADYLDVKADKQNFIQYLQTSGLPEMFHFDNEEIKINYIQSLKNTIILRDIIQRNKIKDINLLDDIFKYLSVNTGNLTSLNNLVKYFKSRQKKTNYETLSAYVEYLKDAFIFHEVERYNLRGKKILGGVKKYYLNDLGFKNYLFGVQPTDIGYHLENFVYLQLKRKGHHINVGIYGQNEIDFVATKGNDVMYVQVAYLLSDQKTIEREFGNLLRIQDNYKKIVISMDDIKLSDYKGIEHLNPWEMNEF